MNRKTPRKEKNQKTLRNNKFYNTNNFRSNNPQRPHSTKHLSHHRMKQQRLTLKFPFRIHPHHLKPNDHSLFHKLIHLQSSRIQLHKKRPPNLRLSHRPRNFPLYGNIRFVIFLAQRNCTSSSYKNTEWDCRLFIGGVWGSEVAEEFEETLVLKLIYKSVEMIFCVFTMFWRKLSYFFE